MLKKIFFSIALLLSLTILVIAAKEKEKPGYTTICLKGRCFQAEVAKTPSERARGLMFRKNLDRNKGMLFIFEGEGSHSFWMKNILIPLDIIWFNKDKEVVFVKRNLQPCLKENCPAVVPGRKAKYVLELNANIVDKIGVQVGDKAVFK